MRICANATCEVDISDRRPNVKYCSDKCRIGAHRAAKPDKEAVVEAKAATGEALIVPTGLLEELQVSSLQQAFDVLLDDYRVHHKFPFTTPGDMQTGDIGAMRHITIGGPNSTYEEWKKKMIAQGPAYSGGGGDMFPPGTDEPARTEYWDASNLSKVIYVNGIPSFTVVNEPEWKKLVKTIKTKGLIVSMDEASGPEQTITFHARKNTEKDDELIIEEQTGDNMLWEFPVLPPRPTAPIMEGLKIGQKLAAEAKYREELDAWNRVYGDKRL